jgi:hypothetical protein
MRQTPSKRELRSAKLRCAGRTMSTKRAGLRGSKQADSSPGRRTTQTGTSPQTTPSMQGRAETRARAVQRSFALLNSRFDGLAHHGTSQDSSGRAELSQPPDPTAARPVTGCFGSPRAARGAGVGAPALRQPIGSTVRPDADAYRYAATTAAPSTHARPGSVAGVRFEAVGAVSTKGRVVSAAGDTVAIGRTKGRTSGR